MRVPRYNERSLAQVLPSVACALGDPGFDNALGFPELSQAVVLVVDGLGFTQLQRAASHAPEMADAARHQAPIDAAFPTTTPAGIATLTLALTPGMHGFVGATFELPDFACVLNPLRWQDDPPPVAVQPEPNVFSRLRDIEVRSHGPVAFAASGMTRTLLGSAIACGYEKFDPRVIEIADGRLDYVYLPQLDKVGHVEGPNTPAWNQCLRGIDNAVRAIRARLPASAALIVTSDHGMVAVPDDRRIDVDDPIFAAGVRQLAGEPRMRHVYTEQPADVHDRWSNALGDRATVLTRDQAITSGLFGEVDEGLADRIGDVVAIAHDNWSLASRVVDARTSGLRGLHGALTDDEIHVPGLLLRGVA